MGQSAKQYNPHEHESAIYAQWEKAGVFQPDQKALAKGKKPYVIMLPPPNITGSLHIGHALQDTIMDVLSRYHRMKGEPVLWQPGTDHAAIATNRVLEEQLKKEGVSRQQMGREKFLERAAQWYRDVENTIIGQMKQLGCSADWSRLRFTMDEPYVHAVQEAFIRYWRQGYIYRGMRIVNWDPTTQTTVSDLEIEWRAEKTPFYYFTYGPFEISTARPETKFGDKYVVVHPDDERYTAFRHEQKLAVEWINGPITATVIKDTAVDPSFGSGAMTITPWHDATDFEIAERHNLDREQIIGYGGKLLPIAGEFAGMTVEEARPRIVEKLKGKGLLVRVDENYEHNSARNERGQGIIEPQVMRQWFVDMSKLKGETIAAIEHDAVQFVPARWKKHMLSWMDNMRDWNINRQIWLGQRIPVWWKPGTRGTEHEEGNYVVAMEKPAADPTFAKSSGEAQWQQDPDVLDTWFSSAIWPLATLGWPKYTKDLKTFYPTSVLVTARDILYLWVARMMFSGLELLKGKEYGSRSANKRIPFKTVLTHLVVLAKDGRRMSKSLGTGIDPLDLVKQYGADATRFGLMYQMSYESQALRFDEAAIKSARNFANKIWNLARLLRSRTQSNEPTMIDVWIQRRSAETAIAISTLLDELKVGEAARILYDFVRHEFADWYAEVLKIRGSTAVAQQVFTTILKLLHPFMPHLTELLWPQFSNAGLLIVSTWPSVKRGKQTIDAITAVTTMKEIVTSVRSTRTLLGIPAAATVKMQLPQDAGQLLADEGDILAALCRATIVDKTSSDTIVVPLTRGGSLTIASEYITTASKQKALQRVLTEEKETNSALIHYEQDLEKMAGKAPSRAIATYKEHIARVKRKLTEVERNIQLLRQ